MTVFQWNMGFASNLQPGIRQSRHPDDIFLWPDDSSCARQEWDRTRSTGKSDDFVVVSIDSIHYVAVSEGQMRYDAYCRTLPSRAKAREPWMLTDQEIDQAMAASPHSSIKTIAQLSKQEIRDLARMESNIQVHPEIDRTEVNAIAAEQKPTGMTFRGTALTVQTQGSLGTGSPQRIRLNLPSKRARGLDR